MKNWVLVVKEMTGAQLESVVSTYSYEFNTDADLTQLPVLKEELLNHSEVYDLYFASFLFEKLNNGHYRLFNNS